MKYSSIIVFFLLMSIELFGQFKLHDDKYWIQFKDKKGTPYSIDKPEEFLSQRAIERRKKQNIPITEIDLPVNPDYVAQIQEMGAKTGNISKWYNAVVVETEDSALLRSIMLLPFVCPAENGINNARKHLVNFPLAAQSEHIKPVLKLHSFEMKEQNFDYGKGFNQIEMLNGHFLHNLGYRGEGMHVAVIDAGFYNVDKLPAFDSLWANNQILGWWDFVEHDTILFDADFHGMRVLSAMAANIPGKLIGTAPKASYWLLRSEDASSESKIEEFNWTSAAEFADSAGVDVINTSLGYSEFDDKNQNYTYSDMDGRTAISSIAAEIAVSKGIMVVNSAGNSGFSPWQYISAPADANNVLSVGAVDKKGNYAYFSSIGPSSDKRIKPNVSAQGHNTATQNAYKTISGAFGTSFSSPVMAGMATCLWQAHPELTNIQIVDAIERSANQYLSPDPFLGYGIPDFAVAYLFPNGLSFSESFAKDYTNLFSDASSVSMASQNIPFNEFSDATKFHVKLYSITGELVYTNETNFHYNSVEPVVIKGMKDVEKGVYLLIIYTDNYEFAIEMYKPY